MIMKTLLFLLIVAIIATSCTNNVKIQFKDNTVATIDAKGNKLSVGDTIVYFTNNAGYSGIYSRTEIKRDTTISYTTGIEANFRRACVTSVK